MEEAGLEPVDGNPALLDDARKKRQEARRVEAMSLVIAGLTYEQIAERMKISPSGVRALVERTLERATNRNVEALREIENARLDRAQAAIWTKVLGGDLKAIDTYLRISTRRAKMNGLDAPTNINLNLSIKQEMEQALNELHEVVMGEVIEYDAGDTDAGPGEGDGDYREVEGPGGTGD
jgi:DNA-binding CsgD family transcriptional regulator